MNTLNKKAAAIILVVAMAALSTCDLELITEDFKNLNSVTLINVNPDKGKKGTVIKISGQGFGKFTAADLTVIFPNEVQGIINSISDTELEVTVPGGAGSGPLTLEYKAQSKLGPSFTYLLSGAVSTFAGSGTYGYRDGAAAAAQFAFPYGIAVDKNDNIFVGDFDNARVRRITPTGQVSTFAGSGMGTLKNGTGTAANVSPTGLVVDENGNIIVADFGNHAIRKITSAAVVSTLAGNGTKGFSDNFGTGALFNYPTGVEVDASNNILVADRSNHAVRMITPAGFVSTFAGMGESPGDVDGSRVGKAKFQSIEDLAIDNEGNVYVSDAGNHKIKKILTNGNVITLAGNGVSGNINGVGAGAQFNAPIGIEVDVAGNIFVADRFNNKIRVVTPAGLTYDLAGDGTFGYKDGPGEQAKISGPFGLARDSKGNIYVACYGDDRIRKIVTE